MIGLSASWFWHLLSQMRGGHKFITEAKPDLLSRRDCWCLSSSSFVIRFCNNNSNHWSQRENIRPTHPHPVTPPLLRLHLGLQRSNPSHWLRTPTISCTRNQLVCWNQIEKRRLFWKKNAKLKPPPPHIVPCYPVLCWVGLSECRLALSNESHHERVMQLNWFHFLCCVCCAICHVFSCGALFVCCAMLFVLCHRHPCCVTADSQERKEWTCRAAPVASRPPQNHWGAGGREQHGVKRGREAGSNMTWRVEEQRDVRRGVSGTPGRSMGWQWRQRKCYVTHRRRFVAHTRAN